MNKETKEAIVTVAVMGTEAFKAGKPATPALNRDLDAFISNPLIDTIAVLKQYTASWHAANLAA